MTGSERLPPKRLQSVRAWRKKVNHVIIPATRITVFGSTLARNASRENGTAMTLQTRSFHYSDRFKFNQYMDEAKCEPRSVITTTEAGD